MLCFLQKKSLHYEKWEYPSRFGTAPIRVIAPTRVLSPAPVQTCRVHIAVGKTIPFVLSPMRVPGRQVAPLLIMTLGQH
jgi:hypothetical protein